MMDRQTDSEALRSLVREVLRELVPAARGPGPAAGSHGDAPRIEAVSIASDAELQAFVGRLLGLFDDPTAREALRTGRHGFRLSAAARERGVTAHSPNGGAERIGDGVLSESKVIALARAGRRVVLGKGVVVTPLARDKARQLGVKLERES